jgi:hypothetical protein
MGVRLSGMLAESLVLDKVVGSYCRKGSCSDTGRRIKHVEYVADVTHIPLGT